MVRIFISTDWSRDSFVADIIARLKAEPDLHVDHSPLNPALGEDPRWLDWYDQGCTEAVANADCFVAVVTAGYDSSTWMGIEFDEAYKRFVERWRPRLFVAKQERRSLPLGFKRYEDASRILVGTSSTVVVELMALIRDIPTGE